MPGRQVETPHIPNDIHDVQEKNLVDDIFDSSYIADPPISADGFLPAHRLAFQHSRRLWPCPCRLHVPQVSFCHLHVPKLFYYHFPYYNHIAPGKLLLVALMCQKKNFCHSN